MRETGVFRIALLIGLFLAISVVLKAAPSVTNMKAFLFYNQSGALSENIIGNDDFTLFNTIIGAGAAKEPSSQTMVVVEINGKCISGACKVEFAAAENTGLKKKVMLKKTTEVFCETEKCNVAFMLYDTGCVPIELTAKIAGSKKTIKKNINFVCGE